MFNDFHPTQNTIWLQSETCSGEHFIGRLDRCLVHAQSISDPDHVYLAVAGSGGGCAKHLDMGDNA